MASTSANGEPREGEGAAAGSGEGLGEARAALRGRGRRCMRPPTLPLQRAEGERQMTVAWHTYLELGSHPWAGIKVLMTLEATDVAGQIGHSPSFEMILPERISPSRWPAQWSSSAASCSTIRAIAIRW